MPTSAFLSVGAKNCQQELLFASYNSIMKLIVMENTEYFIYPDWNKAFDIAFKIQLQLGIFSVRSGELKWTLCEEWASPSQPEVISSSPISSAVQKWQIFSITLSEMCQLWETWIRFLMSSTFLGVKEAPSPPSSFQCSKTGHSSRPNPGREVPTQNGIVYATTGLDRSQLLKKSTSSRQ